MKHIKRLIATISTATILLLFTAIAICLCISCKEAKTQQDQENVIGKNVVKSASNEQNKYLHFTHELERNSLKQKLSNAHYQTFHNIRYDFDLRYPDFMIVTEEHENGDGIEIVYNDVMLEAWGNPNTVQWGVKNTLEMLTENATYQQSKDSCFLIKGNHDHNRFIAKAYLVDGVWYVARLIYPKHYTGAITSLANIIKNFKPNCLNIKKERVKP